MADPAIVPKPPRDLSGFCDAIESVVDRFKESESITLAEAVGALEFVKLKIMREAFDGD